MPDTDPEHYFDEWSNEEFHDWLQEALTIMEAHLHLLPNDLLERIHGAREVASRLQYDAENEVRDLYHRIQKGFEYTRKELGVPEGILEQPTHFWNRIPFWSKAREAGEGDLQ